MNQVKSRENRYRAVWYVFVFCFFYIWFAQVHPLIIFDADDWNYASFVRRAVPLWKDWNPARVFPEIFMPLVCNVSVRIFYPLTGDYMGSITMGSALTVSLFITVYVFCFDQLMKRVFSLSTEVSIVTSVLFLVFHFLAMRSKEGANQYMFYCWDITCYYYYLIPSLLNASLVMHMSHNDRFDAFWRKGNPVGKGLLLLALYLAIFSNLPSSGILAAFAGCRILLALIRQIREKKTWKELLREVSLYIGILAGWFVSAVFELFGGRAESLKGDFMGSLLAVLEYLSHPTVYCGKMFMIIAFLLLVAMAGTWLLRRKKDGPESALYSLLMEVLVSGAALLVYTIVLVVKARWDFVLRSEYQFGLFFYLFLLLMVAFAYVTKKYPGILTIVPLALCVMLSSLNTPWQTYKDSNMENTDMATCVQMSNDLIEQVIAADQEGKSSVILYVPVSDKEINWPYPEGKDGIAIARTLYEHGIVSREIEVTVIPAQEMNEKYNLGLRY